MSRAVSGAINGAMRRARRGGGFSLVELLVALVLASLLLAGIARVFVNSKQGYRVQESASRMQENIRIAVDYFGRNLRLADLWGGVEAGQVSLIGAPVYNGPGGCEHAWILDTAGGVHGYAGGARAPAGLPPGCLSDYVPGSDALAIRYANPDAYVSTAQLRATGAANALKPNGRYYLRTRVGERALLFDVTSDASRNRAVNIELPGSADDGVLSYQYQTLLFYLRNVDFGRGPVPTLNMLRLQSDSLQAEQLVDGIEMLTFSYGVDSDDDGLVDGYRSAADIGQWQQVLSVRVAFIARGDELDDYVDSQEYPIAGDRCYGPQSSTCALKYGADAARFQRRLVVKDIQLRNRVRG